MHLPDTSGFAPQPRSRLTEARNARRWSQHTVAERIGTTYVNVSRWERGITRPNPYFRRKLCGLFGKTEQELDLTPDEVEIASSAPLPGTIRSSDTGQAVYDSSIPPLPVIPLVGRERELAQIKQQLRSGGSVALTALNGLPGIGKTALSITLAHDSDIRKHFRDGILWAGLGPQPNIPAILSHWGKLLGVSQTEATIHQDDLAKALHTAIGSRTMLLVLDDAWKLEEALACKIGGPNCAHLVTTRFPHIAASITVGGATVIQELNENESMALLRLLAPGVVDREEQRAAALVQAVGGLPLALTLMGNYLRKEGYSGQPRRILTALERLSHYEERLHISEARGPVETHPSLSSDMSLSLQSVIAVTDQQLTDEARAALYALSVFPAKPNSFSEEAALAVAACSTAILDTISDTGLLESSSADRYTLHQTICDYARVHLQETTPRDRLINYAVNFIEAHKKDYDLLELESTVILAALEQAHEAGKQAELVRGVNAFTPFLLVRGLYATAEKHLQQALTAAQSLDDTYGITSILLYQGEIAQKLGNFSQAETRFREGLELARHINAPERISALLNDLGWVLWKQGNYTQAETHLQEGLTLARQLNDKERISNILQVLGSLVASLGNYPQSKAYLEEGLTLARQLGDPEQICVLLINLGATVGEQGDHAQAETYFQEGLVLARQIRHREWMSLLLTNLGDAASEAGNYAQAEALFQEGLDLARQLGHRERISTLLSNLGLMVRKQGNYAQAENYFQESLTLARQIGIPQITSTTLYEYGNLYLERQQIKIAEESFLEVLATISEEDQDLMALAQYGLARSALARGNTGDAWKLGEISVIALESMGHRDAKEVRSWLDSIAH